MIKLCFVVKIILYATILILLVTLLVREGYKNSKGEGFKSRGRLQTIDPLKMYKSRTQQFESNAQLRGNVIDYFDGYLPTQIKFDSKRVDMDNWAVQQKRDDVKRAMATAKIAGYF